MYDEWVESNNKVPGVIDDEPDDIESEIISTVSGLVAQIQHQIDANPNISADNQLKKILSDALNHIRQNGPDSN